MFRALALALGLSPLLVVEATCWLCDWGRPTCYDDPFVGFSSIHPLFVLSADGSRYEIPESRLKFFCPESFAAKKAAGEFRIFVLGGSTVQGRPYESVTSFTTWLELSLNAAAPYQHWEVINCGGISYASYRLLPILEECLNHEPDLIIFCEGHNEFLEDRSYDHLKRMPAAVAWPLQQAAQLRSYNLLRAGMLPILGSDPSAVSVDRALLGPEADTRLDYKGGMELFHRDDGWRADVTAHFEFNLGRMVNLCKAADVPLLMVCPVSNLDWRPFKSEPGDLSEAERQEFERLLQHGSDTAKVSSLQAADIFAQAASMDPRHALAHYELGQCYLRLGQTAKARESLFQAREEDVCPLRMPDALRQRLLQVAKATGTPLLDAEALITAHSPEGFPGDHWMIDHVHPKIDGHKLIAEALLLQLADLGMVRLEPDWHSARDAAYRQHFAQLDAGYFMRGRLRLEGEQKWAYGKVTHEKGKKSTSSP